MASAIQQPSVIRKLIYFGMIVVLFTGITFAGTVARVLGTPLTQGTKDDSFAQWVFGSEKSPPAWTISSQASTLELNQLERGKVELTSSSIQLLLTGSRGLVVAGLWWLADEKQKKHEWNEVELLVRSITKLQPHFFTPWLFQSWNLSYNVSVESDRVKDKFFYISKGIELLAEGQRVNRRNPDLRFWIGFYYLNKFGVSDEARYLRSLLQMSCIDPRERDPARLLDLDKGDLRTAPVNREAFRQFVLKHPQLVRRLKMDLRCSKPREVVEFLMENRRIPSRFDEAKAADLAFAGRSVLKTNPTERFPVLPERAELTEAMRATAIAVAEDDVDVLDDSFDNYLCGHSWATVAQEPLPPTDGKPAPTPKDYDRTKYRIPRAPALVIFRQYPSRALSYVGERLQKEGWFDEEGWLIEETSSDSSAGDGWFEEPLRVGTEPKNWGGPAWERAHASWQRFGEANGLLLSPGTLADLEALAQPYRERTPYPEMTELKPEQIAALDADMRAGYEASQQLRFYQSNRQLTNFAHFYFRSQAEAQKGTIEARKRMYEAEQLYKAAERERAVEKYQQAFALWKERLLASGEFRDDSQLQEELFETQLKYVDLLRSYRGPQQPPILAASLSNSLALFPVNVPSALPIAWVQMNFPSTTLTTWMAGPLDGLAPDGKPWIAEQNANTVMQRLNANKPPAKPPTPAK